MPLTSVRRRAASSRYARVIIWPFRLRLALSVTAAYVRKVSAWLFWSREYTNFTYSISARSERHLARAVSQATGVPVGDVEAFQRELLEDQVLKDHFKEAVRKSSRRGTIDPTPLYGRRSAWYALVRIVKPAAVVEAGVDKGLGTLVLAAALKRNAAEGNIGTVFALDLNPTAGHLLGGEYDRYTQLRIGDSLRKIAELVGTVDIFIHDSDHAYEHEIAELSIIAKRMSPVGYLLSDAAADSDALDDFCRERGLDYFYAAEQVRHHWMAPQGVGIGKWKACE